MSAADAPDWERIITTVKAAGDVPDAPDWERIVVGPGGVPVGGGGLTYESAFLTTCPNITVGQSSVIETLIFAAATTYFIVGFVSLIGLTAGTYTVGLSWVPGNGAEVLYGDSPTRSGGSGVQQTVSLAGSGQASPTLMSHLIGVCTSSTANSSRVGLQVSNLSGNPGTLQIYGCSYWTASSGILGLRSLST